MCVILDMVIVWKQYFRQEFGNETDKFQMRFKHKQENLIQTYVLNFLMFYNSKAYVRSKYI